MYLTCQKVGVKFQINFIIFIGLSIKQTSTWREIEKRVEIRLADWNLLLKNRTWAVQQKSECMSAHETVPETKMKWTFLEKELIVRRREWGVTKKVKQTMVAPEWETRSDQMNNITGFSLWSCQAKSVPPLNSARLVSLFLTMRQNLSKPALLIWWPNTVSYNLSTELSYQSFQKLSRPLNFTV